jgi:hypothetical protein
MLYQARTQNEQATSGGKVGIDEEQSAGLVVGVIGPAELR